MTSQEYTQWLKGFLDAVDGYNITKRQFDSIREKLKEVNDYTGTPIGIGGWGTTTPYTIPLNGGGTFSTTNCTTPYISTGTSNTFTLTSGSSHNLTNGVITTGVSIFSNSVEEEESEMLLD